MDSRLQQRIMYYCRAAKAAVRRLQTAHPDTMKAYLDDIQVAMEDALVDPHATIGRLAAIRDNALDVAAGRRR